tara:strand:- start:43 stop:1431 length:1389 start_codon:yes stop_codon:yes gene_type:complete
MFAAKKLQGAGGTIVTGGDPDFSSVSFLSHFDGANNGVNNVFDDGSTNNYTVIANGDVTQGSFGPFAVATKEPYDPAVNGASAYFDGAGDYATLPANSQDLGSGNFTIEAWVYTPSTAQQCVVGAVTNGNGVGSWMFNLNNGSQLRFFCRYNGGTVLDYNAGSGTMTTNSWNHIAVTRDGANLRAFKNGVQLGATNTTLGSFAIDTASVNGGIYYIGRTTDAASNFNGYISNLRIVKGTALYTSTFTPPTAPLTAIASTSLLLNMADAQAIDSAAKNDLTLYGNAKISSTQSKFGGTSMALDGTGDYLQVLGTMPTLSANFTIEFWYYQNTTRTYGSLFTTVYSYATANSLRISTGANNNTLQAASGGAGIVNSNTAFSNTTWLYIALVRSGSTMTLYQNGVSVGSATNTQSFISSDFTIGDASGAGSPYYLDGYIDDFRITNGVARYTSNFTPPTEPFLDF